MKINNLIYYDSKCALRHSVIKFLLLIDTKKLFYFSPIQFLTKNNKLKYPDSFLLSYNGTMYYEGKAIIKILLILGSGWRVIGKLLNNIPIEFINRIYKLISKYRSKWTAQKKDYCPIIPSNLKNRFVSKLDKNII